MSSTCDRIFGVIPYQAIEPAELARSLSRICRFAGHLPEIYSVAQHSLFIADRVPEELELAALLHDAHESVINDVPLPIGDMIGGNWADIKLDIDEIVCRRYSLSMQDLRNPEIKRLDRLAALAEYLTYRPPNVWWPQAEELADPGIRVSARPIEDVEEEFYERLTHLMREEPNSLQ